MTSIKVEINYVDGKQGVYQCKKRPYFNYENNTATLHLDDDTTMVVNMLEVISVLYPEEKK